MKKQVLCYGDSNTWGYSPHTTERYPSLVRWVGVLAGALGADYDVIPEGLNGRTTVWDDPLEGGPNKNGAKYLAPCLESHMPLDLVVVMLGTNDLKHRFSLTAFDIAQGVGVLVDIIRGSCAGRHGAPPRILLVVPPPLVELGDFRDMFQGGLEKSKEFCEQYRRVAEEKGCPLLDASEHVTSSLLDGVHWEPDGHKAFGLAVASRVRELLPTT